MRLDQHNIHSIRKCSHLPIRVGLWFLSLVYFSFLFPPFAGPHIALDPGPLSSLCISLYLMFVFVLGGKGLSLVRYVVRQSLGISGVSGCFLRGPVVLYNSCIQIYHWISPSSPFDTP
jgi:hypothetical protein